MYHQPWHCRALSEKIKEDKKRTGEKGGETGDRSNVNRIFLRPSRCDTDIMRSEWMGELHICRHLAACLYDQSIFIRLSGPLLYSTMQSELGLFPHYLHSDQFT